jgi:hypothetical protein
VSALASVSGHEAHDPGRPRRPRAVARRHVGKAGGIRVLPALADYRSTLLAPAARRRPRVTISHGLDTEARLQAVAPVAVLQKTRGDVAKLLAQLGRACAAQAGAAGSRRGSLDRAEADLASLARALAGLERATMPPGRRVDSVESGEGTDLEAVGTR